MRSDGDKDLCKTQLCYKVNLGFPSGADALYPMFLPKQVRIRVFNSVPVFPILIRQASADWQYMRGAP